jgi:hypothetical protein
LTRRALLGGTATLLASAVLAACGGGGSGGGGGGDTLDLGRVRGLAENGDVPGAKELLGILKSPQAVEDAIAEVQAAS